MKNFIVIQLFLLVFSLTTNAQWNWQHPYPQGNELKAILMNGSLGWAVGTYGTVMKTTNEGFNWELIDIGTKEALNSITFSI